MVAGEAYRLITVINLGHDAGLKHPIMLMIYAQQPTSVQPIGLVRIEHRQLALALADMIYVCPIQGPRSKLTTKRALRLLGLSAVQLSRQTNTVYTLTAEFTFSNQDYQQMFGL